MKLGTLRPVSVEMLLLTREPTGASSPKKNRMWGKGLGMSANEMIVAKSRERPTSGGTRLKSQASDGGLRGPAKTLLSQLSVPHCRGSSAEVDEQGWRGGSLDRLGEISLFSSWLGLGSGRKGSLPPYRTPSRCGLQN